jgi:hypothetical protein
MWSAYRHYLGHVAVHDPVTMTVATVAGGAIQAAGTLMGGQAAADAGRAQQGAQYFKAAQEEQAAQESRASQQRVALDKAREGRLLQSRLQANAAASGGGAADPTILDLSGGIAGRSEYESLLEMYKGENRARGLEDSAVGSRMSGDAAKAEGDAKKKASYFSAAGTLIGSAGSAYKTYKGTPSPSYG